MSEEDEYGISVAVWSPDRAKVEVKLSWLEAQDTERLVGAAGDLARRVIDISEEMVR